MYKKCIKRLMLLTVLFVFCMGMNVFAAETEEPVTEVVTEDYTDTQTIHIHKYYKESPEVGYTVDAYVTLRFNYDDVSYSEITACVVSDISVTKNGYEYYYYTESRRIRVGDSTTIDINFTMNDGFVCTATLHVDEYGVVDVSYSHS